MGFFLHNGQPVHTSFLNPEPPKGEAPVMVTHTADGSAILHIAPNVAYEVWQNGDLVVIIQDGEKTVYREVTMSDLTFPSPSPENAS